MADRTEYNRQYHLKNRERLLEGKKQWYQENKGNLDKEALKEKGRAYYQANKHKWPKPTREQKDRANELALKKRAESPVRQQKHRDKAKKWHRERDPNARKASRIKVYGLTLDGFNKLLEKQGNKCAICGYSDTSDPKRFPFIDHCHTNKNVRGILCCNCNHAIGHMKDSPELLRAAALYLERQAGRHDECTPKR